MCCIVRFPGNFRLRQLQVRFMERILGIIPEQIGLVIFFIYTFTYLNNISNVVFIYFETHVILTWCNRLNVPKFQVISRCKMIGYFKYKPECTLYWQIFLIKFKFKFHAVLRMFMPTEYE